MTQHPVPNMTYRVWLNPQDDGPEVMHEVRIRHVDRVAAERAAVPLNMGQDPTALPQAMVTSWLWAAMKRQGLYDGPLTRFLDVDCLETEPIEEEGDQGVPPTAKGPGSDSP